MSLGSRIKPRARTSAEVVGQTCIMASSLKHAIRKVTRAKKTLL